MSKDDFTKFLDRVKDGIARFPMDVANIIAETATEYFKGSFQRKAFDGAGWKRTEKRTGSTLLSSGNLMNSIRPSEVTADWKNAEAQHWNVNRAKNAQVFDANQMYIKNFPNQAASYMDKVSPKDWGIELDIKQLQEKSGISVNTYHGTPEEYWETHKTFIDGKEYLVLEDYIGRKWRMDREAFDRHTTDKWKHRAERVDYLNEIISIAINPDEVWLGRDYANKQSEDMRLTNYTMLKYYTDKTLVVSCKVEDDMFLLKTWFPVGEKKAVQDKVRSGLLVMKKEKEK